jgi:hypothetical protein
MKLEITRREGLRNDLLLRLERDEIETALLSVAHRERLLALPGIPRHRTPTPAERTDFEAAKLPIEAHLRTLGVVDEAGRARRPAIAVSNRNLGANHGHVAWQRTEAPRLFTVREDPIDQGTYSCLTAWCDGRVSIEDLCFDRDADRVRGAHDGRDLGAAIEWAAAGQRVLRAGRVAPLEEIIHRFYDIRHVLAFDPRRAEGARIRDAIYRGYPGTFRQNVTRAWRDSGVPRATYVHNAVGLSPRHLVVLQREGTIEGIAAALLEAGAEDGIILDNGGSVACWVWWANDYAGALVSPTVDYRPPGTSAIALVLKGPVKPELPGGSVSYTVL